MAKRRNAGTAATRLPAISTGDHRPPGPSPAGSRRSGHSRAFTSRTSGTSTVASRASQAARSTHHSPVPMA
ncbi:MAG: hypothetical protein FWE15_25510, partial [Actinomycetia bacterium]|nr:hypothetical protein [Actinomycetes bacterium]